MTDFWFSVLWSLLIAAITIIADWLAAQLVTATRSLAVISRTLDQATSDSAKLEEVREQLHSLRARHAQAMTWGADLALVALSLDFAALGLWLSNSALFPFFLRWNSGDVSREIPAWLVLLGAHAFLLLASIVLKQFHGETIANVDSGTLAGLLRAGWFEQNRWMIASNAIGFLTLLSGFVILTDAL